MRLIRHGDVLLFERGFPQDAQPLPQGWLLVPGENGHAHILSGLGMHVFKSRDGEPIIFVPQKAKATIDHPEHGQVQIPPGIWGVRTQRRFDFRTSSSLPNPD
jgi:hypothetical protein